MTEEEWLVAERSGPLLRFIEPSVTDRKLHLFAVACARRIEMLLIHPESVHGIDVLERFADGECGADELSQLSWDVEGAAFAVEQGSVPWIHMAEQIPVSILADLIASPGDALPRTREILTSAAYFVDAIFSTVPWQRRFRNEVSLSSGSHFEPVSLVHEVFGNPFRKEKLKKQWRTSTVVSIAQNMYSSRNFSPMPLLADALEDANCHDPEILNHCRSGEPHVRGCWVVDLLLGKS